MLKSYIKQDKVAHPTTSSFLNLKKDLLNFLCLILFKSLRKCKRPKNIFFYSDLVWRMHHLVLNKIST